jgi:hypothetical protein
MSLSQSMLGVAAQVMHDTMCEAGGSWIEVGELVSSNMGMTLCMHYKPVSHYQANRGVLPHKQ